MAHTRSIIARWLALLAIFSVGAAAGPIQPPLLAPAQLTPLALAIVVNVDDAQSVAVGRYYQKRRVIPEVNVLRIHMRKDIALSPPEFARLMQEVNRQTPTGVQAYVLTWPEPYRVGCMSITSAFTFGFDSAFCSSGCHPTRHSAYFDSPSHQPMTDYHIRPAMSIAASTFEEARALIDRGIAADGTAPRGTAYLLDTNDVNRDVRAARYSAVAARLGDRMRFQIVHAESLIGAADVMFYFIGKSRVDNLASIHFRPGAAADHLTSTGGALTHTRQMSSLRWLEAGASGSYGTVTEPCNFVGKFPDPGTLIAHYLAGDTLIEAYWKSVLMPGQGIFIGEPLTRPYPGSTDSR